MSKTVITNNAKRKGGNDGQQRTIATEEWSIHGLELQFMSL